MAAFKGFRAGTQNWFEVSGTSSADIWSVTGEMSAKSAVDEPLDPQQIIAPGPANIASPAHSLASGSFSQNWNLSDGLMTGNAGAAGTVGSTIWDMVPAIVGYSGAGLVATVNVNPATVVTSGTAISLKANSSTGDSQGGLHEMANDTVAFQGSGSSPAPNLVIYLNSAGRQNITFTCTLRELDNSVVNQQVAIQYRVGGTGNFVNLPTAFVPSTVFNPAGNQTQLVNVTLPADANNQAQLEIRIITTDVTGSDANGERHGRLPGVG